jgi:RNA polymerase sigma-70 factor (ECF subfamily)
MLDDDVLIRRAVGGDLDAFEQLIQRKRDRIYWVAYRVVGQREDAEDITQQVSLRLWQVLRRFRRGENFDTWVYRITVNASIDYRRRSRPGREVPSLDEPGRRETAQQVGWSRRESAPQERALSLRQLQGVFDELAAGLGERQRAVIVLREVEGLPTETIARILGVSHSTVRNHLLQARRTLARRLRERYPELVPGTVGKEDPR